MRSRDAQAVRPDDLARGRACGVLLVCEHPTPDPNDAELDRALPHLAPAEQAAVRDRYLGQTTWRALCDALDVPPAALPDTADPG